VVGLLLAEDLLLLVTDNASGRLSVPSAQVDVGLGGANMAELTMLGKNVRPALYERLAGSGAIRPGRGRTWGIFPARTWPAQDAQHEEQVRDLVIQTLVQQTSPDDRTAALIALLHALRCEHKIVDPKPYRLSRRQLRARAAQIAEGNWASAAVRTVIIEMASAAAG
jgi:Golgi phosphoprotein 3 (GPP34)